MKPERINITKWAMWARFIFIVTIFYTLAVYSNGPTCSIFFNSPASFHVLVQDREALDKPVIQMKVNAAEKLILDEVVSEFSPFMRYFEENSIARERLVYAAVKSPAIFQVLSRFAEFKATIDSITQEKVDKDYDIDALFSEKRQEFLAPYEKLIEQSKTESTKQNTGSVSVRIVEKKMNEAFQKSTFVWESNADIVLKNAIEELLGKMPHEYMDTLQTLPQIFNFSGRDLGASSEHYVMNFLVLESYDTHLSILKVLVDKNSLKYYDFHGQKDSDSVVVPQLEKSFLSMATKLTLYSAENLNLLKPFYQLGEYIYKTGNRLAPAELISEAKQSLQVFDEKTPDIPQQQLEELAQFYNNLWHIEFEFVSE